MSKVLRGRVFKYGDDINTDVIFPGRYTYSILDPNEMAKHALEDLDPDFVKKVKKGDFIVAGKNFGMGSSREQAVVALVYAGVAAVIAKSFARIYFRNAINNGLLVIQAPEAVDAIEDGDEIEIDLEKYEIRKGDKVFKFAPLPPEVQKIIEAGGLVEYVKQKVKEKGGTV
ncbi:MAG: 3-isopropylmalate dehydratase [Candidatus Hydrothermota bacterium]|nr:MAG: 3-isopropylmalate dehydratase [Candidatus Hydrothermae bacterium]